jgi:hypothetical protein
MRSETWAGKIDFPTLGDLVDAWIEQHCVIPAGFQARPAVQAVRLAVLVHREPLPGPRGRVYDPDDPPLNQAFAYRLTQVVGPQKIGKGPWCACLICVMAAGPDCSSAGRRPATSTCAASTAATAAGTTSTSPVSRWAAGTRRR